MNFFSVGTTISMCNGKYLPRTGTVHLLSLPTKILFEVGTPDMMMMMMLPLVVLPHSLLSPWRREEEEEALETRWVGGHIHALQATVHDPY